MVDVAAPTLPLWTPRGTLRVRSPWWRIPASWRTAAKAEVAAITRANQYSQVFATTVNPSVTWTNAVAASDVVVVFVCHNNSSSSTAVTKPTAGASEPTWNTLTGINMLANVVQSSWIQPYWATGTAITAGHVSTWTLGTATRDSVTWALHYTGVETVTPVDQQGPGNFANVAGTAWDSGTSATTTNPNDVLLAVASLSTNGPPQGLGAFGTEVPTGWTAVVSALKTTAATTTQGITFYGWENIVAATSAPHLAATANTSTLWAGTTLALKAAATKAPPFPPRLRRLQHVIGR